MKTTKRIAELQAVVDGLKQEETALKERIQTAERDLYEAQRELRRNLKPTPAMLATLKLIAQGAALRRNIYSGSFYTRNGDEARTNVRDTVFYGLIEREALTRPEPSKQEWFINDRGRAMLERWAKKD